MRHRAVADALAELQNPLARALGGALWWRQRLTGGKRAVELFPGAERYAVPTGRFGLTNHPEVYVALRQWLLRARRVRRRRTTRDAAWKCPGRPLGSST